ncbi:CAP domain-containing protein [Natrinema gelatinilyticum]|uniref:CAP domain-containing protein n=1 Tax=Natrinema gelatinilyticum TaxID=2961571 RepID=UPI0020C1C866|nr:CAP domain-containing protein [Natrinema gelatinilyticum]
MKRTRRGILYTATGVTGYTVTTAAVSAEGQTLDSPERFCPRTDRDEPPAPADRATEPRSRGPVADIGASETTVEAGTEVTFDATGTTGDIEVYAWEFGDATDPISTTDDHVAHTYAEPGEYTTVLAVRDVHGEYDKDSISLTVSDVTETDTSDSSDSTYSAQVEAAIHDEVNAVRAREGLDRIAFDEQVAQVARGHSRDMAENDFFSHVTPDGETVRDRFEDAGLVCKSMAENILYRPATADPVTAAKACVESWMGSSGHRRNILDERWDSEGLGVVVDEAGRLYATQNFDLGC